MVAPFRCATGSGSGLPVAAIGRGHLVMREAGARTQPPQVSVTSPAVRIAPASRG